MNILINVSNIVKKSQPAVQYRCDEETKHKIKRYIAKFFIAVLNKLFENPIENLPVILSDL